MEATVILTLRFSNLYLHALLSQQLCQSALIRSLNTAQVTLIHCILHDTLHSSCQVTVRYLAQASYLCQYREISTVEQCLQHFQHLSSDSTYFSPAVAQEAEETGLDLILNYC